MTENQILALGFKEIKNFRNHQNDTIKDGVLSKNLAYGRQCNFETESNEFDCTDLKVLADSKLLRLPYQLLQIDVDLV
jgi:hypothetical protein